MNKFLFFASALAGLFLAGSCQREDLAPVEENGVVTFEVSIPQVMTKTVSDDGSAINSLVYDVYYTDASVETAPAADDLTLLYKGRAEVATNGATVISVELMNDKNYVILFWAQRDNTWGFATEGNLLKNGVHFPDSFAANAENIEAFSHVEFLSSKNLAARKKNITLKRPFAQINLGSLLATNFTITPTTSSMVVKNAGASFDLINQVAVGNKPVEFTAATVPGGSLKTDYTHVGMNYIFANGNVEVDYVLNTEAGIAVSNTVSNVPVAANYRTNIIGKLFTSEAGYSITLEGWGDEGADMDVITEGLVKNINGDYEISNENGLAYAINNLFAQGGDFYLTKALYDLTGYAVNPPAVPTGVVLNIYGETPVVTRAASTFAGISIIGLPEVERTPTLIASVADGGSLSISGVNLQDEGSVLVVNNEGTLVISETTADVIVSLGNNPVEADKIKDFPSLKVAIESGIKVIEIAADINASEVLLIGKSLVINGNGFTLTTSANRACRLTTSENEVVINNLNIISTYVRVYPNDARGVSIDAELSNVSLTLNNCTIDFVDKTTNDWTYAVNVSGNGTGHKVTVNGGTYEGANVVNVHGAKNIVTIQNATLTSLYPANEQYYGSCIWVLQEKGSSVYAEGNTFNGTNAIAFNLGTGTALEEKENTDKTMMYRYKSGSDFYYTLEDAIATIQTSGEIKVLHNAEVSSVTIPNGKDITLSLNGKTIEAVDNATGSYGLITNKGNLTILGPGEMKLSATNNREWNAYSSVISNTVGGNLTVDGGVVIEHLGGTDMAYGIDNLTNGKGTSAVTTIKNATVKSTYRAVRQFLNGVEATNELYVKEGAVIEGANKSIWMQDPSKNANTGKLVVEAGAKLYGDVYLFVTAGSTEWPVSASIPVSTLMDGSNVITGNIPSGYTVENVSGVWQVIKWTTVSTADELVSALEAKQSVIFANDIKIDPASMSNAYGATGINVKYGQAIDGNGFTLNIKGAGGTWDSGINTTGGLIKNLTVTGSFRGIFINHTSDHSEKVVLENVTLTGVTYTISCDQGLYQTIEATNCTFNGWTSFAKTAGEAKFVNCNFGEGSGYKYCRPYSDTEFVGCTFCPGYAVDQTRATVTFTDCTWEE